MQALDARAQYRNSFHCAYRIFTEEGITRFWTGTTPRLARRCGPTLDSTEVTVAPWNCTYGAKQAIYWLQKEGNTFFEGDHDPPYYNELYGFTNGAQTDIFQDSELPTFDESGDQSGFFTLGDSTVTTASIVFPTVSSGWKTTVTAASGQETTQAASSSTQSTTTPEATSSENSKNGGGSVVTNAAQPEETSSSSVQPTVVTSASSTFSSSSSSSASVASATAKWYEYHLSHHESSNDPGFWRFESIVNH